MTSYLSTGIDCWSTDVCQDILTEVGFRNVTVIFSGATEIDPEKRKCLLNNLEKLTQNRESL